MSLHLGIIVHPTRNVMRELAALDEWSEEVDGRFTQIETSGQQQVLAPFGAAEDCDALVAIGGDGTSLAAIRAAAPSRRPVLGVACGSLGVLTSVPAEGIKGALDRFARDEWRPLSLPALEVHREHGELLMAYNDIVVIRRGEGQVRAAVHLDGQLFARIAGDGGIISTPVGSSAYALAAGGPLLAPGADSFLFTPLSTHGGFCPALVAGPDAELKLELAAGREARLEVDGRIVADYVETLSVRLRPDAATIVTFADQEPFLAGLRRRGVLTDSPRILAEDERGKAEQEERRREPPG